MIDELISVVLQRTPIEFGFISHTWTCNLLILYIHQTYSIKISIGTIWTILKQHKLSYKGAQAKPTKADKKEQEAFKKNLKMLDSLESSSNKVVYSLDENGICIESSNRSSWSPIGTPPILEKNDSHNGINVVGSTCILNNFHIINDIYSSKKKITSEEIKSHLKYLIETNPDKKVIVFLDNAKIHKSKVIQEFYSQEKEHLELVFLPKYSPYMNPQ